MSYANYEWTAAEANVLHGIDSDGRFVDTPDVTWKGDVFAKPGSHVMFFKEFANAEKTEVIIIDATRSTGKLSQRTENVLQLFETGYKIYCKNN